jgi:predicted acyltransferase
MEIVKGAIQIPIINSRLRLLSLDFFRGITVAAMILVNNPGSWSNIFSPLRHSEWDGCTPTDFIFAFFLFIIGVSIVYAMDGKRKDVKNHPKLILAIFKRSFIILAIGAFLALSSNFDWSIVRIPGILPRIALVFCISGILYVKTATRTQIYVIIALLVGYYILMNYVDVPGYGHATLDPANNLGIWVDRFVFSENHLWQHGKQTDPEGLLSTLPAVATVLIGLITGTRLKSLQSKNTDELAGLIIFGIIMILVAIIGNAYFPINKSLWTSTYVLYTAGFAILFLAILHWLIDIKGYMKFIAPFIAFGRNAITAYVIAGIVPVLLYKIEIPDNGKSVSLWNYANLHFFMPYFSPNTASLIPAVLMLLLVFAPIWWMYKRKIVIKI